jgi:hypothetical protein
MAKGHCPTSYRIRLFQVLQIGDTETKSERMKKWFTNLAFFLFSLALIAWTSTLTLGVMDLVLPNNRDTKYFALALYDGGVITWLFVYVEKAKGTPQRGMSLALTIGDFIGVALMVIGALYLGGQSLANGPAWMGKALVNGTIIATLINLAGVYYYHANAPEVGEAIQAQELEDDLNEEALDQARMQIERSAQQLGAIIANRVTARLKYRLRLPMTEQEVKEWQGEAIDAEAYDVPALPYQQQQREPFWSAVKSFFGGRQSRRQSVTTHVKNSTDSSQDNPQPYEEPEEAPAPTDPPKE